MNSISTENCNTIDFITGEPYDERTNPPGIRILLLNIPGETNREFLLCASRNDIRDMLSDSENEMYHWIPVRFNLTVGEDGQFGYPNSREKFYKIASTQIFYVADKSFIDLPNRDFVGVPIYRNKQRVGNQRYIVSGLHGQAPGYNIYYILPADTFNSNRLYELLLHFSEKYNISTVLTNESTIEQLIREIHRITDIGIDYDPVEAENYYLEDVQQNNIIPPEQDVIDVCESEYVDRIEGILSIDISSDGSYLYTIQDKVIIQSEQRYEVVIIGVINATFRKDRREIWANTFDRVYRIFYHYNIPTYTVSFLYIFDEIISIYANINVYVTDKNGLYKIENNGIQLIDSQGSDPVENGNKFYYIRDEMLISNDIDTGIDADCVDMDGDITIISYNSIDVYRGDNKLITLPLMEDRDHTMISRVIDNKLIVIGINEGYVYNINTQKIKWFFLEGNIYDFGLNSNTLILMLSNDKVYKINLN